MASTIDEQRDRAITRAPQRIDPPQAEAAPFTAINWWVTFTNLVGCGGFMIAALSSFVPPHSDGPVLVLVSLSFTLIGALGFLIGSLLMLAE